MSSVKLPALTSSDLGEALQTALVEVSENAFIAFIEPCGEEQFAALVEQAPPPGSRPSGPSRAWLKASVGFVGEFSGSVEIAMPERLGTWLVASLLGMASEQELPDPETFDGVGEFANMVCGAWLSRLGDKSLFELRVPAVTRMADGWNPVSEEPGRAQLACRMAALNDLPMRVRVHALWEK